MRMRSQWGMLPPGPGVCCAGPGRSPLRPCPAQRCQCVKRCCIGHAQCHDQGGQSLSKCCFSFIRFSTHLCPTAERLTLAGHDGLLGRAAHLAEPTSGSSFSTTKKVYKQAKAGACLQLLHGMLHVQGGVLAEIDQPDVAQLVPVMVHCRGVHRAQLQLLPLQVDLCSNSYAW